MLSFKDMQFHYDPYPIGLAKNVLDESYYNELIRDFPAEKSFVRMDGGYNKFSLSEVNNPKEYRDFILTHPIWGSFYKYIKSLQFVRDVFTTLHSHKIEIGKPGRFKSRFEFSSLPANGGYLKPHRDIPSKVVTLIIPTMARGVWNPVWGGGTDVLKPKHWDGCSVTPCVYPKPLVDYKTPLEEFDRIESLPCDYNNCVVFIKTDNSWHSVGPISGPVWQMRRTVTINIERVKEE